MGTIYLRRLDDAGGSSGIVSYWYKIPVFDDISIDYNSPASPMPLPEEDDEEQIIVKVEGNSSTVSVSWLIKEETSNMGAANTPSFSWGADIKKVWEQVSFLQEKFVPTSVSDSFEICFDAEDVVTGILTNNAAFDFKKAGTITKLGFRIPSNEPATLRATLTFMVGNVVTAYALDTPSAPKDISVTSTVANRLDASWSAPRTTGQGTIKYWVFYKRQGTTNWLEEANISSTSVQISLGSGLSDTVWDVYVRAKNDNGYGERTEIREVTIE
tara:strand:- start:4177 stop:4989 length:813 start_codon:yes stop_codon:yes gene_type:complete